MASAKAKAAMAAVESKFKKWTFEVSGSLKDKNFRGTIKNENGKPVITLKENEEFNQISALIKVSKYMENEHDMRGLALWLFDRNLIPLDQKEKAVWKKKKLSPVDIREVSVV